MFLNTLTRQILKCNDLDQKDREQVFGEMVTILDQIRNKYKNTKFIISEITPRNDNRDNEVKCFNSVLVNYAKDHSDVTVAYHHNLRDPNWTMFADAKHIHANKIAKFAANIIKTLKKAYNINDKSELFPKPLMQQPITYHPTFNTFQTPRNKSYHQMRNSESSMQNISSSHTNASNGPIDTRFRNLAGYDSNKTYSSRVKSNEYPCNANNLMSWV